MSIIPENENKLIQVFITSDLPEVSLLLEFTPPTFMDLMCTPQYDAFGLPKMLPNDCHRPRCLIVWRDYF